MGSFNVTCSLSRVSISAGDEIAIIPAITADTYSMQKAGNQNLVFQPTDMFHHGEGFGLTAVTTPIWGTYDDYGSIEVHPDEKHEALIQKMYGMSLEAFATSVTRPWDKHEGWSPEMIKLFPDGLFCIFILKDAYEKILRYMRKTSSADNHSDVDIYMLEFLGFSERTDIKSPDKRYDRVFMREDSKSYAALTDGTWSHIYKISKKKDGSYNFSEVKTSTYHPDSFVKAWEVLTGKHMSESWSLGSMLSSEIRVKKYARGLVAQDKIYQEYIDKGEDEYTARRYASLLGGGRRDNDRFMWGSYNSDHIKELYTPGLRNNDEDIIMRLAEYKAMQAFMFLAQIMFMPAMSGPQCGDYEATQELGNIITALSRNKLEEREDW